MTAAPMPQPAEHDLEVARRLALAGVPLFVAKGAPAGDGTRGCGFWLPARWQLSRADPGVVDLWEPGDALCAVMGVRMDLLDVDPRNGGDEAVAALQGAGMWPRSYGRASTPSGGTHDFVARLRTGSRDNVRPGLDVKGGRDGVIDRAGRGFAFIAPTVRASKVTGELAAYVWDVEPDLDEIDDDDTVGALAQLVADAIGSKPPTPERGTAPAGSPFAPLDQAHAGPIPEGQRHHALFSYASRLRARGLAYEEALALWRIRWADCEQPPAASYLYTEEEARATTLDDAFKRYAPDPVDLVEGTFGTLPTSVPSNVTPLRPEYAELTEDEQTDAALEAELLHNFKVAEQLAALRVREDARRAFQREQQAEIDPPAFVDLSTFLAVEDDPQTHRIEGLWPSGGRVLLAAAFKAGKSTAVGNVLRSLVDGDLFLDVFPVEPVVGKVGVLDNELDERNLRRWLRDQGIRNTDQVVVVPMRGKVGSFDLLDPVVRSAWAARLKALGIKTLIFDCLRPVLDALGLSEDKDAGRFLVQFDALLAEADVEEALVVHHTGHDGERSRGDSRLRDWPDAEWRITRLKDGDGPIDPSAPRFFAAYGRDVEVAEGRLEYDHDTRHLAYVEGDRKAAAVDRDFAIVAPLITSLLAQDPPALDKHGVSFGWSARAITDGVGQSRQRVTKVLAQLVDRGLVLATPGPNRSVLHSLTTPETARSNLGGLSGLSGPSVVRTTEVVSGVSGPPPFKGGPLTTDPDSMIDKGSEGRTTDKPQTMIELIPGLLSAAAPESCPCGRSISQHGPASWATCGKCRKPWHALGMAKLDACPCSAEPS